MSVVNELYRVVVLEHGKRPRHRGPLAHATHAAEGDNPLCGDAVRVEVAVHDGVLTAVGFSGESCAIATASASLMGERLAGLTTADACRLADAMESLCAKGPGTEGVDGRGLGDLLAFADVHRHPVRIACATLAWRVFRAALAADPI